MDNYKITPPTKDELTSKGFTNKIKINEGVTVDQLIQYGFTNNHKPSLYYSSMIEEDVSFNLSVDKETLEITSIDVLDEDFGQPYDYQMILMDGIDNSYAKRVFDKVNDIFNQMKVAGIITGFKRGMYI